MKFWGILQYYSLEISLLGGKFDKSLKKVITFNIFNLILNNEFFFFIHTEHYTYFMHKKQCMVKLK